MRRCKSTPKSVLAVGTTAETSSIVELCKNPLSHLISLLVSEERPV